MRMELTRPLPIPKRVAVPKIEVKLPKLDPFFWGAAGIVVAWGLIAALVVLQLSGLATLF